MNIIFAGTPAFAIPSLNALAASPHQLKAIYTQPDRPAGRGRKLQASAVKEWAQTHNLPVFQPVNFKQPEHINELAALKPDLMVVIAYGLILPQAVLDLPRYGCINVHASLLPRWRGASPIQHAVLEGDEMSGVTIMQMNAGMDTGDMLAHLSCQINHDTAGQLHDRLASLAAPPLLETINAIAAGQIKAQPQDNHLATYAPKINKEDAKINWHSPAATIDRQIRAFNPWPIAYTHANNNIMRVYQAEPLVHPHTKTPGTILAIDKNGILVATKDQAILIKQIQFPGGKSLPVSEWLHAHRDQLHVGLVLQ